MSYTIILIPAASRDIVEAWQWYKNESPGLELKYWDAIHQTLQKIAKHPGRYSPAMPDIRVALVKRFPYKIIFYTNELMQRVEIIAVVHNKRNPRIWKKRL